MKGEYNGWKEVFICNCVVKRGFIIDYCGFERIEEFLVRKGIRF